MVRSDAEQSGVGPGEVGMRTAQIAAFNAALRHLGYETTSAEEWEDVRRQRGQLRDTRTKSMMRIQYMTEEVIEAFVTAAGEHESSAGVTFGRAVVKRSYSEPPFPAGR